MTDTLPNFIFARLIDIERDLGLVLAGALVTDIPRSRRNPSKRDMRVLAEIIEQLTAKALDDPDMFEAGIWRSGSKPDGGANPPFDNDAVKGRMDRCLCIEVRVRAEEMDHPSLALH
jgi:hypothetical protein